jgi:hypothetical protein
MSNAFINGTSNNLNHPTDLSIALLLIHELIHAHFFALYDDFITMEMCVPMTNMIVYMKIM